MKAIAFSLYGNDPRYNIGAALDANDRFIFDIDRKAQLDFCDSQFYKYESDRWGK